MKVVKKTGDYTILEKRSGRYGVKDAKGSWMNGPDKSQLLHKEGLIKLSKASEKKADAAEETTEAPADS